MPRRQSHTAKSIPHADSPAFRTLLDGAIQAVDGVLARLWGEGPGDSCHGCAMRPECPDQSRCLHLVLSAGVTDRIDGAFRRFPLGVREVGAVHETRTPFLATEDLGALGLADRTWLMVHDVRSFIVIPLLERGRAIGVLAVFARAAVEPSHVRTLEALAELAVAAAGGAGASSRGDSRRAPARRSAGAAAASSASNEAFAILRPFAETEREIIERVLDHTEGRVSGPAGAARILGLKRTTLLSRMKKLRVRRPR